MIRQTLLICAITAAALHAADKSSGSGCDHACLQGFVDSYLDAMAKHDPSKLPVAEAVRVHRKRQGAEVGRGLLEDGGREHLSAVRFGSGKPATPRHRRWWRRTATWTHFSFG